MSRYSRINQSVLKSPQQTSNRTSVLSPSSTNFIEFTPQRSTRKAALFSNDQEIFLDCATPLILVSDNNILNPSCRPSGKFIPAIPSHVGSAERLDTESRKSERESKPRTSVWSDGGDVSASAAPSGRKARLSQSQMSNSQGFQKAKAIADSPEKAAVGDSSNAVDIFKTEEDVKEENIFKKKLKNFLDSTHFNITVGLFIFYALFADDFRVLLLNSSADLGFDVVLLLVLAIFSFEIVANLIVDKNYLWSFFFWLDIVSTVSIIFDVRLISNDFFPDGAKNTAQLARASRAARIGTRAGRVVRIFRLVRLAKVYKPKDPKQKGKATLDRGQSLEKVYPAPGDEMNPDSVKLVRSGTLAPITRKPTLRMQQSIREKDPIIKRAQSASEEVEDKQELKESRVGKRLSDLTTKRVVVIVLALLLFIPFFSADFYFDAPASQEYEATLLNLLLSNSSVSDNAKTAAIQSFMSQELANEPSLVYLQIGTEMLVPNANTVDLDNPADLRDDEQEIDTETGSSRGDIISIVSSSPKTRLEAGLNMLRTVFVCVVLIVGALLFSKDANTLVLRPIERMIEKVNKIAGNPMIAKEEALIRDKNDGLENETIQIENAIIKIGGLLALGFGDAGSVIVTQNMARSDDLNAIVLGRKELAIFGFCDIRNFTDATEVLQEDVMVFVNSIAEVVHSVVDLHTGAANKNIGDAFLLVWKFPESEIVENDDLNLEVRDSKITQAVADLALISFLKINIKINRDPKLLAYRSNAALNVRLPNYQVKMGFGLHVGWAIEGAIGSEFKVDASYLSPNVNLASRLEAATKQYGVPLLFSGELYNRLSMEMREKSRLIDIVTVKGSSVPMEIYTVDMDVNGFTPSADTSEMTTTEKREIHKLRKKKLWDDITEKSCTDILENDYELNHAFRNHSPEFNDVFAQGFQAYIQGDWAIAKKKFEQSLSLQTEDGPTKNLLGFLKENDYIAPEDWDGYHVLTEK